MPRIDILVANPNPKSFAHALAATVRDRAAASGLAIAFHDLYAEGFDPVLRTGERDNRSSADPVVERHVADLVTADLIAVCHPNWWGMPPAILKGWIDRVIRPGVAYDYPPGVDPAGVPVGLLRARRALVFNTSNTVPDRERDVFGDPLETIWRKGVFEFSGIGDVVRRVYGPMARSDPAVRRGWLDDCAGVVDAAIALLAQRPE